MEAAVQTFPVALSEEEAGLIATLREVAFGEMYGVRIAPGPAQIASRVSAAERALILEIRDGLEDISVLHVHEGQPAYAEVDEKIAGFRCRKKIKFPAE